MGLLNAFANGVSGVAASMADSYGKRNEAIENDRLAQVRSDLDLKRAEAIERLRNQSKIDEENRTEARQIAPLNRFGKVAGDIAASQTPTQAGPVTMMENGFKSGPADGVHVDFQRGSYDDMIKKVMQLPEGPDRDYFLGEIEKQRAADQQTAQMHATAQDRKTVLQKARDATMYSDPQAYMASKDLTKGDIMHIGPNGVVRNEMTGEVEYANTTGQDQLKDRLASNERIAQVKATASEKNTQARIDAIQKSKQVSTAQIEPSAQMIARNDMPPLTGRAAITPEGLAIMNRVMEINPQYRGYDYGNTKAAVQAFDIKKQGDTVRSLNVAIDHIGTLEGLAEAIANNDTQAINRLGNAYAKQTGSAAPTNFEAAKKIVSDEITKAIIGGASALGDREENAKSIMAYNSPEQLAGAIATYKDLMGGQLHGLRDQYVRSTHRTAEQFNKDFLTDNARTALKVNTAPNPVDNGKPNRPSLDSIFGK